MNEKPECVLAVSAGDPLGVGPEITVRSLESAIQDYPRVNWMVAGDVGQLSRFATEPWLRAVREQRIVLHDCPVSLPIDAQKKRRPNESSSRSAWDALNHALQWVLNGTAHGLVTAPLAKEGVAGVEPGFTGHTEYLGSKTGSTPLMMLGDEKLKVFLVTTHLPLSEVTGALSTEGIQKTLLVARAGLQQYFGRLEPRLAVLGLNPHAGEGGLLGREEEDLIRPGMSALGGESAGFYGPFAADGFFGSRAWEAFDGVVALYHDQGLIPLKTLCGMRGVNVTLGLPFLRTSPDHGTAYDRAGTESVDSTSMRMAVDWCIRGTLDHRI